MRSDDRGESVPGVWGRACGISPPELLNLWLYARGCTAQQVQELRGVGYETVKAQRANACHKLGATGLAHAVALLYESGVFPLRP